jgi:ribosomal protein S18 acetylase RimI-like enzyme
VRVRELKAADLDRIREIDRSESVRTLYVHEQGQLQAVETDLEIPTWGEARVEQEKKRLTPKLEAGGVLLGALDGDQLVGVAALGGEFIGIRSNQLEVAFLYVNNGHRGRRIAKELMDELCRRARERGAEQLYVSSSDTESAIRFYLRYGCRPAERVDPALAAENEPTDIPLTLDL